jgi:hypothetical protein
VEEERRKKKGSSEGREGPFSKELKVSDSQTFGC